MSNFISKADYYIGKRQETISQLTNDDDTILDTAEEDAIDFVKKKLQHYDVDTIFGAAGNDRDKTVLRWCKYIVLYYIFEGADDAFVPESVIKNYDDTIEALDKISNGRQQIDLPRQTDAELAPKTKFRSGGSSPRSTF